MPVTLHRAKRSADTDPRYGVRPEQRPLDQYLRMGLVLLDKPAGPTSRQAADAVRRALGVDKAGHGGTLDPRVTGVLAVLLGSATRAASALLGCDKVYEGTMRLHGDVEDADLAAVMEQFRGAIEQLPPRRSRVKREPRVRTVYSIEATGARARDVEFRVVCQRGTYIRKLVHDMGQALGCGAHMTSLRRTRAGPFGLDECTTLAQVESAAAAMARGDEGPARTVVTPVDRAVARVLPAIWVDDGAVHSLTNGAPLCAPGVCALDAFEQGGTVAVMTLKDELVGLARAEVGSASALSLSRGVVARMHGVLMRPGAYPKFL